MFNRNVLRLIATNFILFSTIFFQSQSAFAQSKSASAGVFEGSPIFNNSPQIIASPSSICDTAFTAGCGFTNNCPGICAISASNAGETGEVGEPRPNYPLDTTNLNSDWWFFQTTTVTGSYAITTRQTNGAGVLHLDTEIAVYTWSGVGGFAGLTKIASSDDWGSCAYPLTTYHPASSCVIVNANPATKFWIQIDGKRNAVGNYVIDIIPFTPTAANVSVSGRVTTPEGAGVRNARVLLTDSSGNSRSAAWSHCGTTC